MSTPTPPVLLRATELAFEARIAATPQAVWRGLVFDIARWWPNEFFCGTGAPAHPQRRRFAIEARPGGRMYEDWGDGDGLLWAMVVNVHACHRLELAGTTGPQWGGPCTWFGSLTLEPDGEHTRLCFAESAFGRITAGAERDKEKGWRFLWGEALRAHCEGKEPPRWQE